MYAEVIAVGSELTSGAGLDTNSRWLSVELAAAGIPVRLHTTVADELPAMVEVLRGAVERSDVVIVTGGLGPTLDDLTRQALAELLGVELVLDEPSLRWIEGLFASRGRDMPERNRLQAMLPAGTEPIPNPTGTAPGIWVEIDRAGAGWAPPTDQTKNSAHDIDQHDLSSQERIADPPAVVCRIAALPGVPGEMRRMFREQVLPRLPVGERVIRQARINCFGMGESHAEAMLGELTARGCDPEVGITVHEATITLRITAHGHMPAECDEKIARTRGTIRELMGEFVFGEEDEQLEDVVLQMLAERGLTLSTAESGTGGLLAHRLTEAVRRGAARRSSPDGDPAAADGTRSVPATLFLGGAVVPTEAAKRDLLGIDESVLSAYGAISEAAARGMAVACRTRFKSDFALAITEHPRLEEAGLPAAPPTAYLALAGAGFVQVEPHVLVGDPAIAKSRSAKAALNMLRLRLLR